MLSHNSDALNGLRRHGIFHNLGPKWSEFVQAWRHIPSDPPKVALVWLVLPDTLSTPVNLFWSALHALVSHYQGKQVPVLLFVRHSRTGGSMWKYQTFRSWRGKFSFQHTRHCYCKYGLRVRNQPLRCRVNVLALNAHFTSQICDEWQRPETDVQVGDIGWLRGAHQRFAAEIYRSLHVEKTMTGEDTLWDVDPEAQYGPDSTVMGTNSVGDHKPKGYYPTEARERQKAKEKRAKEAGKEVPVRKKHKVVEEHYDDCGDDISSLKMDKESLFNHEASDTASDTEPDPEVDPCSGQLPQFMLTGLPENMTPNHLLKLVQCDDMTALLSLLTATGPGIDIAELCASQGEATKVAVRRQLPTGHCLDFVTYVDLSERDHREAVDRYLNTCEVLVLIVVPVDHDMSGEAAQQQLRNNHHFVCVQPVSSLLYLQTPWPQVLSDPRVSQCRFDRCMLGLPSKAPSTITASHPSLLFPFRNRCCEGKHVHTSVATSHWWTWFEASYVMAGISHLFGTLVDTEVAYPRVSAEQQTDNDPPPAAPAARPRGRDHRAQPMGESDCLGCRRRRARDDPEHNRVVGQCSYPYDESVTYKCPACKAHLGRSANHTYIPGECRMTVAQERKSAPRKGRAPRDPRQPASDEPTAGLPGTHDGQELGAADEQAVEAAAPSVGTLPEAGAAASSSSSSSRAPAVASEGTLPEAVAASSSSSAPAQGRGPDQQQRVRRTFQDQAAGPERPNDWTQFDISRVVRTLRLGTEAARRRELRKLHIRWWHASAASMIRLLDRAGVQNIATLVHEIVDTCAACRKWSKPLPASVASVNVPNAFNEQVECDILFIYDYKIFHMIDRCTRWHAATLVEDKSTESLIGALNDAWITIHGPMKELISDGETAIAEALSSGLFLARHGIKLCPRATDQHARYIERRGAIVRDQIHRTDAQLEHESITGIPFKYRLAEAVFAGNALISVNNTTPYNAVYGRVPRLLPDINQPNAEDKPQDGDNIEFPGLLRNSHRLREIAVQAMVEGSARARLGRAAKTRSLPAGQAANYQLGELVDFYRPAGSKDISGWAGPATVVDTASISRGTLGIKFSGRPMNCKLGEVRRHIAFMSLLAAEYLPTNLTRSVLSEIQLQFSKMRTGDVHHLGWRLVTLRPEPYEGKLPEVSSGRTKRWQLTEKTNKFNLLLQAALVLAKQSLNLRSCIAIRVAKGAAVLTELHGYDAIHTIAWKEGSDEIAFQYEHSGTEKLSVRELMPDTWHQLMILQICLCEEEEGLSRALVNQEAPRDQPPADAPGGQAAEREGTLPETSATSPNQPSSSSGSEGTLPEAPERHHIGDLAPIPEEGSTSDLSDMSNFLTHDDPALNQYLFEAYQSCMAEAQEIDRSQGKDVLPGMDAEGVFDDTPVDMKSFFHEIVENYHIMAANQRAGLPVLHGCNTEDDHVELLFYGHASKLIHERERAPLPGEVLTLRVYTAGPRRVVVQRDDDTLTAEELRTHAKEVAAAMLKELLTWAKLKCFSRRKRQHAKNVIDCRWVIKWKHEIAATAAGSHDTPPTAQASKRVIRARLTVRGFKDQQAHTLDSYAGTSQRYSQRLVCSEAVVRGWPICTTDISKAFLQGVTYEELSQLTGEPIREVNFTLPRACTDILRQVPGFEDFDENMEVLHCDKPGTGLVDAPRAFSMKLSMVTKDQCHMMPTTVDNELCVKFERGTLICIMAKHVDDLKLTGDKKIIVWVLQQIEKVFGELKIIWHEFTNCGIRHIQVKETLEISLDQEEYIKNLKPIQHAELSGPSAERECSAPLVQLFMSLLGAVAYALMTRVDIAVFVCALQRVTHKPQIIHIKRLNAVLRWMQANPKRIWFRRMTGETHLRCVGDAAFRKEETEGRSLRGALFLRAVCVGTLPEATAAYTSSSPVHIIDAVCKSQRHVTRSTFSSELLSACDTVDHGMLLALTMHELTAGVQSCIQSKTLREAGGWNVKLALYVDAMSVFAAVTATFLKIPAERSLLSHVQYLRELLDTKVLEALVWIDTRDMCADGLTKGSIDRELLHAVMGGIWTLQHEAKCWTATRKQRPRHILPTE